MRYRSWLPTLSGLILGAGVLLLTPRQAGAQQMQMMAPGQAEVIRGLLPTVVNITAFVSAPASTGTPSAGASNSADADGAGHVTAVKGSGLIIDPSGIILTNHHVIAGAADVQVMFSDGESVPGRVLAIASITDLALVKVDTGRPLAAVRWADSDKVQVGDAVFAIGNPLGVGLSVSAGIVSALNRNLADTPFDDFIQTDAAINHGNSGGPLFNRDGEVIGVDTAIISPTSGSVGIGFAIPANDARSIADMLIRDGHARPAYLGIKLTEVTPDIATALGMTQPIGSIIDRVHAGGPAANAGVQVGDVILRYGERTPSDERALLRGIAHSTIEQPVTITVLRAGQKKTLQVTPIAWPDTGMRFGTAPTGVPRPVMQVPPNLGLSLHVLTADVRARY